MASNIVLSTQEFNVVGTRPIRHDGVDKVTGRARYSADINLPGLLHGKILRSPHAPAHRLAGQGFVGIGTAQSHSENGGEQEEYVA